MKENIELSQYKNVNIVLYKSVDHVKQMMRFVISVNQPESLS